MSELLIYQTNQPKHFPIPYNQFSIFQIVILNDNGQVSLPTGTMSAGGNGPASSLSAYTSKILVSRKFQTFRDVAKGESVHPHPHPHHSFRFLSFSTNPFHSGVSKLFPENIQEMNKKIDEYARGMVSGGTFFEELGFYYVGPVDGHDLDNLVPILEKLRDSPSNKPILLHLKTNKGHGYPPAENASDKMHGVGKFDVATGVQVKPAKVSVCNLLSATQPNPTQPKHYVCPYTNPNSNTLRRANPR